MRPAPGGETPVKMSAGVFFWEVEILAACKRRRQRKQEVTGSLLYISVQVGVELFLQDVHGVGVGGQIVEDEGDSGAGGLVAAEDENEGLGEDLLFSQA